jgi:DNA topoisomerase-1
MDPDTLTLERAIALLSMPRVIGVHPESGEEITSNLGRFGPYLKSGALSVSLTPGDDVLSIGMNRAMELLANAKPRGVVLGNHPKDGAPVEIKRGRFGPYAQHGSTVASLPRGTEMEAVTLDQAVALLTEKGKVLPPRKGGRVTKKRAKAGGASGETAAKPTARKAAGTKAPARAPAKTALAKKAPVSKAGAGKAPAAKARRAAVAKPRAKAR